MIKISKSKQPVQGASHQPTKWGRVMRFTMGGDGWTNLITHYIWFYRGRNAHFIKIVRSRTRFERHLFEVRQIHDRIRREEAFLRRRRISG